MEKPAIRKIAANTTKHLALVKAISLLLIFGMAMGGLIVLSKPVINSGISGLSLIVIQNMTAGALLIAVAQLRKQLVGKTAQVSKNRRSLMGYLFLSALLGIALPHWLVYTAAPKIGVGLSSVLYLFAPLMTYAIALLCRHDSWDHGRGLGMLLGFVGGMVIAYGVFDLGGKAGISWQWLLIGLLAPASLAAGNVFRSEYWPESIDMTTLSGFTLLMAGGLLLLPSTLHWPDTASLFAQTGTLLVMVLIAAIGYLAFFSLQFSAGAIYVSQSGYVVTAIGITGGVWLYSESINWQIWAGILMLCTGVAISTRHLFRQQQ